MPDLTELEYRKRVRKLDVQMVSGIVILLTIAFTSIAGAEIYRWSDDRGVVHITDDYARIPARDRSRVTVESDTADGNVVPSEQPREKVRKTPVPKAGPKRHSPEKTGHRTDREEKRFSGHRRERHESPPPVIPLTPARKAQEMIEEQQRKNRQQLDNSQLPARRAQERNEEQIRRTREGISGH